MTNKKDLKSMNPKVKCCFTARIVAIAGIEPALIDGYCKPNDIQTEIRKPQQKYKRCFSCSATKLREPFGFPARIELAPRG